MPGVLLVVETVMVQPAVGTFPAVTLNVPPPAAAVVVTPVQVPPTVSGVALTRPAGYVSVNCRPVTATPLEFVNENVRSDVAPGAIGVVANALAMAT